MNTGTRLNSRPAPGHGLESGLSAALCLHRPGAHAARAYAGTAHFHFRCRLRQV